MRRAGRYDYSVFVDSSSSLDGHDDRSKAVRCLPSLPDVVFGFVQVKKVFNISLAPSSGYCLSSIQCGTHLISSLI